VTTKMLRAPDVCERMSHEGTDPVGSTPEEFSKRVASELVKSSKLIKDIGI
jgi:tripartite-type tricarboxylate transporter receptor subunit TctC